MNNILIIYRDELMGTSIERHIKEHKWQVLRAQSPRETFTILEHKYIGAVLVVMKGMEREWLKILKGIKKLSPFTEIITINNSGQVKLSIKCMKAGVFDDFFTPLDMDFLFKRISDAANRKKKREKSGKKKLNRFDRMMMAVSFAEAGEIDTAKQYIEK